MASVFVEISCDIVEFYKDVSPLPWAQGSTQGMRNYHNTQELEEQLLTKPHALSDKVFLQLKREPGNTIHFI